MEARLGALSNSLNDAEAQVSQQAALITSLTGERDAREAELADAQTTITGFEAQVAALLN